jgi:hypothetical protein
VSAPTVCYVRRLSTESFLRRSIENLPELNTEIATYLIRDINMVEATLSRLSMAPVVSLGQSSPVTGSTERHYP